MILSLGYSPCPNDTFIFHALTTAGISPGELQFSRARLEDVETLNTLALRSELDVTKLSFHAFGHLQDEYQLLTAGAALGTGCGPLLVGRQEYSLEELRDATIAIPGKYTTAAMLLQLFLPQCRPPIIKRFDQIMPAIAAGEVDCGVIIHESRFTYSQYDLRMIQDLGAWWEKFSGRPIPLGGIAARRSLGYETIHRINTVIRESVLYALAHPSASREYVRRHARELADDVIARHIDLYVNSYSKDLGENGINAVRFFLKTGHEHDIFKYFREDFYFQER